MEIGVMLAGVKLIQSLDLDPEATHCMSTNGHYFAHAVLTADKIGRASYRERV